MWFFEYAKPRAWFSTFCSENPIHGLCFFPRSAHLAEIGFWFLATAFCTYKAVHDIGTLLGNYLEEPTMVTVELRQNRSLFIRQPLVCVDFPETVPLRETDLISKRLASMVVRLRNCSTANVEVRNCLRNDPRLAQAAMTFLGAILQNEASPLSSFYLDFFATETQQRYSHLLRSNDYITGPLQQLYVYLQQQNFTTLDLLHQSVLSVCDQAEVRAGSLILKNELDSSLLDPVQHSICRKHFLEFIGLSGQRSQENLRFCFQLRNEMFRLQRYRDGRSVFSVQINTKVFRIQNGNNIPSALLGIHVFPLGDMESLAFSTELLPGIVDAELHVHAHYKLLNLSRRRCLIVGEKPSTSHCIRECVGNLIQTQCGCRPLWNPHSVLRRTNITSSPLRSSSVAAKSPPMSDNLLVVNFRKMENDDYIVFQERVIMDTQTFLSSLGGVLGVWLGASFLAFLHIPVFLIRSVILSVSGLHQKILLRRGIGRTSTESFDVGSSSKNACNPGKSSKNNDAKNIDSNNKAKKVKKEKKMYPIVPKLRINSLRSTSATSSTVVNNGSRSSFSYSMEQICPHCVECNKQNSDCQNAKVSNN